MPNKEEIIVGSIIGGFIGLIGFIIYTGVTEEMTRNKLNKTYTEALYNYADTDRNQVISPQEKEVFIERIVEGKNAIYITDDKRYQFRFKDTGKGVSDATLTEWIDEYVANQKKWSIFQQ
ncbi:hypothetical protein HZA97_00425 [Candidatus Woesearchaeota archaeon]|nr:hypothetical protein [Candidatus Woesearchaeota archaeon]